MMREAASLGIALAAAWLEAANLRPGNPAGWREVIHHDRMQVWCRIAANAEFYTRIYCAGGWYSGDTLNITQATQQGLTFQFGGGPMPQDWYGVLDAVVQGRLDPLPSIGKIIGLDEVPDAIDQVRRSEGPPRIVVHPNGNIA